MMEILVAALGMVCAVLLLLSYWVAHKYEAMRQERDNWHRSWARNHTKLCELTRDHESLRAHAYVRVKNRFVAVATLDDMAG